MRKVLPLTLVLGLAVPQSAAAWGFTAHRYIMRRAIDLLPSELKPFYTAHRDEIVMRVVDPDLWRAVGWDENPNHFLDFGVKEYGPYPFRALPRAYEEALDKFGADPAVSSAVFVTAVTDIVGFFAFLGIATWWYGISG